jgi:lipoate-protein ligase A
MTDAWRLIDSGACVAAYNMALDEAIATYVRKDMVPPTLRLYGWIIPSVSIGYFQKIDEIDVDYCSEKNIPIVRRLTGGRAVLHNYELTYSFSVKTPHRLFSKSLLDNYKKISRAFGNALLKFGLMPKTRLLRKTHHMKSPLCFQSTSYGEIIIDNKKVIGSAQKRWSDGLLQQGTIPYYIDKDEIVKVFRIESSYALQELIGLKDILPEFNLEGFKKFIRVSFEETFHTWLISSTPSKEELRLTEELKAQKYLSNKWNFQR